MYFPQPPMATLPQGDLAAGAPSLDGETARRGVWGARWAAPISANRLFVFNVGRQPQPQSFGSCLGVRSNDDEGEGPVVRSTVHSFIDFVCGQASPVLRCIPPAFPAPALLRATFYEFKRTPVTMINTMTPVRWRCPSCIYTGYLRCADEGSGRIERI